MRRGKNWWESERYMKSITTTLCIACSITLLPGQEVAWKEPDLFGARNALREAVSNARQIGLMLFEFETDYGAFPNEETGKTVAENAEVKLPAGGKDANSAFRQIFAAGITQAERAFHARIPGVRKGDDNLGAGKILERGENAFAYISGQDTAGNPARPLIICPIVPGTTKFDPRPFGGKAVILRIDLAVLTLPIDEDGRVSVDGVDLLSKENPVWEGKEPDVRHPDLLPVE